MKLLNLRKQKKDLYTTELEKVKVEEKKTPRKFGRHTIFKAIKILILIVVTLIVVAGIIASLSFLRYRQMCSYQGLVNDGRVSTTDDSLCPDPLKDGSIQKIVLNIFDFNFQSKLSVSSTFNNKIITANKNSCDEETNPLCWIKQAQGELKQTDGYTNVLLVGSDSRNVNSTMGNTDSIMLLSFQHSSGQVLLISFPRDLTVRFRNTYGSYVTSRINSIYAIYGDKGIDNMNAAISQIIGKPIHYYAYFNFETFTKIIDDLGGIDINLAEPFGDAYPCNEVPKGITCKPLKLVPGFGYFTFPAGKNHFSSFDALVYARARELSTDYSRAGRQQEIVKATINTALHNNAPLKDKFNMYINMYNTLRANVKTNIGTGDITGLFKLYDKLSGNVATIVVAPSLGNYTIVKDIGYTHSYGWSVIFYDYTYRSLQNLISNTWKFLPYNNERPKVLVLNATGKDLDPNSDVGKLINSGNPFWQLKAVKDNSTAYSGVRVYDMSQAKPGSLNDIMSYLPKALLYNAEIENIKRSGFGEDVLIVVGK